MNGRFWRPILITVVSALIIGVGAVSWSGLKSLYRIEAVLDLTLPNIEKRLTALEFQRRGRP